MGQFFGGKSALKLVFLQGFHCFDNATADWFMGEFR